MVNNVETLSNLPWIMRNGSDAFFGPGRRPSRGTKMLALSGHVRRPGNYEVEFAKVSFRDLIYDAALGGGIREDRELKAFIPGGVSSPWFGPHHLDLSLANEKIAEAGSMAGSGAITVMDETTCVVRAVWRITRFFHRESCGQCTPCREGSGWVEKIMRRIEDGQGREADLDLLDGHVRQHCPRRELAPGPDDHLRARPVDPELGGVGDPHVPRRVLGATSAWAIAPSRPTGCKRAPHMPDPRSPATRCPASRWPQPASPGPRARLEARRSSPTASPSPWTGAR